MRDTSADVDARVCDAVRRQPTIERLRATLALSESMRAIALLGLRARFPGRSTIELVEMLTGEPMRPTLRVGPLPTR